MKAAGSFKERQLYPNIGEQLFEAYCIKKGVQFFKVGFNEKTGEIPQYWKLSKYIRNLPDYFVVTENKTFLVMVKGTGNLKKTEAEMIPKFLEWYGSEDVGLYYAFCFEGQKNPLFMTPSRVLELYQQGSDKQWTDGKIYRTLSLNE